MGNIGKITSLKKEYEKNSGTLEGSIAQKGWSRFPNTTTGLEVHREPNGKYRTGLDEDALYLSKLAPEDRKLEQARIKALRQDLENQLGIDLGPKSDFYRDRYNTQRAFKAVPYSLREGDNMFNFEDPMQRITYEWLRVHPLIASSYQAYERGEYPSSTQFFVNDDAIEEEITYRKKTLINDSINVLINLSLEKRQKVARLLGLPITDKTKEHVVYNVLDTFIKESDIKEGEHRGANPIEMFNRFAKLDDKILHVRDLVAQALRHSIYRVAKGGKISEGGVEVAKSKEDLIEYLLLDKNQEDKIALEEKLDSKKGLTKA